MLFRKSRKNDYLEIFNNGSIPDTREGKGTRSDENPRDADPLAVLRSSGINTDLIPDSLLPTIASSFAMNTDEPSDNARIKVDCSSCNRPVAYGRGKCMYCGKPLELPESAISGQVADRAAEGNSSAGDADQALAAGGLDINLSDTL